MTDPHSSSGWSDPTSQPASPPPAAPESGAGYQPPSTGGYTYQSPPSQDPYAYPAQPAYPTDATYTTQPQYPVQPMYPQGYGPAPQYVVAQPTNGLAIASMIMAIIGFGPIAAIMGHVARKQIQERGEQGDGFALAGIIVGWVTTAFWVLCCGGYALALAGMFGAGALGA